MDEKFFTVSVRETIVKTHTVLATSVANAVKTVKENRKFITDDDDIVSREFQIQDEDGYEELSDWIDL